MALLSLQAFKKKWAELAGRFKDNSTFDIAEKDYREFSEDIADSLFEPVELLRARVEKLEQPAPPAPEGAKWNVYPKVSTAGNTVKVTASEVEFHGNKLPLATPNAKENVPLPPAGWGDRIDILAASADGWVYIYGQDPGVTPAFVHPDQPEKELLFAAYLFWSNAGGVVEEPVVFVKTINGQAPDANGNINIQAGGTTIDSTDDIQNEGAVNKWWTELRSVSSRTTANLWSYLGLVNASATITLKGWLDLLTSKVKTTEDNFTNLPLDNVWIGDANGKRSITKTANIYISDTALIAALRNGANWQSNMYQAGIGKGFKGQEFASQNDLYVYKCIQDGVWCRYPNNAGSLDIFNADGDGSLTHLSNGANWVNGVYNGSIAGTVKAGTFTIGSGYVYLFVSNNVPIRLKRE